MAFLSTITRICARCLLAVLFLFAGLSVSPSQAAGPQEFAFVYLYQEDDPAYAEQRAYTGLKLRERKRPLAGAETALKDVRILGRALGLRFTLESIALPASADAADFLRGLADRRGARVFLLDLPLAQVRDLGRDLAREDVILFNIRHGDAELRQEACGATLFHTMPSLAMRSDALAQFLAARNWLRVLVLEGEAEADRTFSAAFQASARKFGLSVVAVRPFVLSNDPREREQNNVALMTAEPAHDVVFLADDYGEFGRYVPFATYLPRPVVGSEGLVASAWHWTWERHGAPQLNQRFGKLAGRLMADEDWAAWAALRVVVEAIAQTRTTETAQLRATLTAEDFTFDLYKGFPGSFRSWDHQLRQPVLLHSHNAVIASAPLSGFLHARNELDSLGRDQSESRCRF
jgi:ABC transporter substrate binding protein (PQQ-dependent alcohol dehydrogenase system)